jgi:S-adenosyl-L-methionine hydrolase (adenosine-forming)
VKPRVITLTTDFGTSDTYAGVMKGVLLSGNPSAVVVDITHEIAPQDVRGACFALLTAYSWFPKKTIHLVIVDPGVGSKRRPLIIETEDYFFVGPDNGVFTPILAGPGMKTVFEITDSASFLPAVSSTFHGRDIFAPVAARISKGARPSQIGAPISDYVVLDWPQPVPVKTGAAEGEILHSDRFGNLITNFSRAGVRELTGGGDFHLRCAGRSIKQMVPSYAYAKPGQLCYVFGSSGFLEIAVSGGSAARELKAGRGQKVRVLYKKNK